MADDVEQAAAEKKRQGIEAARKRQKEKGGPKPRKRARRKKVETEGVAVELAGGIPAVEHGASNVDDAANGGVDDEGHGADDDHGAIPGPTNAIISPPALAPMHQYHALPDLSDARKASTVSARQFFRFEARANLYRNGGPIRVRGARGRGRG